MTYRLQLGPEAVADIDGIIEWSAIHHGLALTESYVALIGASLRSIAKDPYLLGSHRREDLGPRIRTVHLGVSRHSVDTSLRRIAQPRHIVVYRQTNGLVQVVRLLHQASDIGSQRIPG